MMFSILDHLLLSAAVLVFSFPQATTGATLPPATDVSTLLSTPGGPATVPETAATGTTTPSTVILSTAAPSTTNPSTNYLSTTNPSTTYPSTSAPSTTILSTTTYFTTLPTATATSAPTTSATTAFTTMTTATRTSPTMTTTTTWTTPVTTTSSPCPGPVKMVARPNFKNLQKVYPTYDIYPKDTLKLKKDMGLPDWLFHDGGRPNTCAIRMSKAFHDAGLGINRKLVKKCDTKSAGVNGKGKQYIIRVLFFRCYLRAIWGRPDVCGIKSKKDIKGKKGILIFTGCKGFGQHIDLWDGTKCSMGCNYFSVCTSIELYILP